MVKYRGIRHFSNLILLVVLLILPLFLLGASVTEAQDCAVIQRVGFDRPVPFVEGEPIRFGVSIGNQCGQAETFYVELYIDGQLWDSGPIPVGADQSTTIWADNYWIATAGIHTLIITADGSSMSRSFTVNQSEVVCPRPISEILTVNASPSGGGSVNVSPSTYNNPCACYQGHLLVDCGNTEILSLTATPNDDWIFDHWEGSASGTNPSIQVVVGWGLTNSGIRNPNVTAVFQQQIKYYTLTTSTDPYNGGDVNPSGGQYVEGTEVTLTAQPFSGWEVVGWKGVDTYSGNIATVIMNSDRNATAYFEKEPPPPPPAPVCGASCAQATLSGQATASDVSFLLFVPLVLGLVVVSRFGKTGK